MFTLPSNPVSRLLRWWIGGADRFAPLVIVVAVVGAAISIHYARNNLGVNTDTADMISPHLPWRRAYDAYKRDFPHTVDTLQVVIDGETPELAARASRILAGAIAREHALVHWVYDPGGDEFFLRHGLLYSTIDDLEALADALADAQPLLATLMREPNLAGLAGLFTMLARREVDPGAGLGPLLRALDEAADAVVAGRYHEVSWRRLMLGRRAQRIPARSSWSSPASTTRRCFPPRRSWREFERWFARRI